MSGRFTSATEFRRGPTAWDSTTAEVSITRDLDGCVVREEFNGRRYGAPYRYLAIWGVHGDSAAPLQRTFVHSQHGLLGVSSGTVAGDSLILSDSALVRGRWIHERTVRWRAGRDLRSEDRRSEDGGRTWFATQRSRYTRVPGDRK